ncbi:efflux RND transporter periplasmic adaptor subunit [Klenkia taihuensis]|uniref:Multidrug efflux pump subunit AcrA (Membrane-fusion protein) n=1 Tax=Klenkia taihuensis TaxID=1225127 RepID=A0A1I1QBX4_9ACTN|nr:efflux RND transporter periplasmic adaptor subunit [Klenkia taihuensis]GHE07955.1 hypothetical protein GCM10011381_06650 [Klenkia taihuensis]SFD19581.1 Multidrug efflux pump subunit AcrA (membrane-fusion protein) [Klenkia taihuensis]
MRALRSVVLPTLRLLVWVVIAVALAVLAFRGPATEQASGPSEAPPVDLASPLVPVSLGTVSNVVSVQGTVAADPATPVRATAAGTVRRVLAAQGAAVTAGQPVLEIRSETERDPVTSTDADGNTVVTPREPLVTTTTVKAASAGTLTAMTALVDQVVAVGDTVGELSPGTLSITATLTQDEQFRLLAPPTTAEVTVQGGPAPFTCAGLALGAATSTSGTDPSTGGDPSGGTSGAPGTTARCSVPAGTAVFPGMAATVDVDAGTAADVLTLPITAVQGSVQNGTVWLAGPDGGDPVETPVTLGLNDGSLVQITGGVAEGDQVLEFVPVPDDTVVDGGMGGFGG